MPGLFGGLARARAGMYEGARLGQQDQQQRAMQALLERLQTVQVRDAEQMPDYTTRTAEAKREAERARLAQVVEQARAREEQRIADERNHAQQLEAIRETGRQARMTREVPTPGRAGTGVEKPVQTSDGERKALFYHQRAKPAADQIARYDSPQVLDAIAQKTGMLGNWAKTPEGRLLDQASRVWVMAVLRQDSQGTISDSEMENYRETYLPVPGDDAATLAQKAEARRVATEGLLGVAGRAAPPSIPGEPSGQGEIHLGAPTPVNPQQPRVQGIVAEAVRRLRSGEGTWAEAKRDLPPAVLQQVLDTIAADAQRGGHR